ncbi:MAG TPA: ABC transporter substrate-binding protein [Stackebrandtia sp.]|jgi:iron complex transport system substrate-binding protein|uniref:ABC transporter substrate-binding protein n=1 Tax=Stackebrandtia sp. TaxID=2023065 RepID=UPI002D622092|nr:ABC transporter substrate-binding protein [Stackebrandtia sp.]HZE39400.1 ABC transporter substrate-binding protein [Stackebrandtia sp.]
MPNPQVTRRGILGAAGALTAGAVLAACGAGGAASGSGSWKFTDDRGKTARVDGTPKRAVAYIGTAAALYDYGVRQQIAGVYGPTKLSDGKPDPQAGDLPIDDVVNLGNTWGKFNVEKYASLKPQVLITNMYQKDKPWFLPDESADEILKLAPAICLSTANAKLTKVFKRFQALAKALGADQSASRISRAVDDFESASDELRTRAKAKKRGRKLTVMAASADDQKLYVVDPSAYCVLSYYRDLGVEFIVPDKTDDGFYQYLSWENADKYSADIILMDNRVAALQPKDLTDKPTFMKLPAIKEKQYLGWASEARFSHAGCAPFTKTLADALEKFDKVT